MDYNYWRRNEDWRWIEENIPNIGLIGLNSLSLIVGRTNLNVMFASLGAGGGQQNSGNFAGLQPTTQSNMGTNAGLVGRNRNLIFAGLAKKAKQYSFAILWVPTSGTGKMARVSLIINSISLANVRCQKD